MCSSYVNETFEGNLYVDIKCQEGSSNSRTGGEKRRIDSTEKVADCMENGAQNTI